VRKFLTTFLVFFLALGGLLFLLRGWVAKEIFEGAVRGLTGFDAKVGSIALHLRRGEFHLREFLLFNPQGFEERIFADVPEVYLHLDFAPLLKNEGTHFHEIRLHINQLHIEKTPQGVSNVSLLSSLEGSQAQKAPAPKPKGKARKPGRPFQLDRLVLTLRKVSYNDRAGFVPKKISVDMHVNQQVFEGIRDPKSIINVILMKVVSATPFGNLGINTAEIQDRLKNNVKSVRDFGEKIYLESGAVRVAEQTQAVGKQVWGEGKETVTQAGTAAKEEITSLFGKLRSKLNGEAPPSGS